MVNKIPTLTGFPAASAAMDARANQDVEKAKSLKNQKVDSPEEVDKAAGGFEALLLHQMFESMWSTVEYAGMFNETSNESQIYRDMMSQAVAETTAEGPGMGIKQFLRNELLKYSKASKE